MIKILFFLEQFNHGGAERVLRDLVNHMDQSQFDITVQTVWPYEEGKLLSPGVKYKFIFPVHNSTAERLYRIEAALKLIYPLHIKDDYDIECAYLEYGPTKIIASSTSKTAKKLAWVHCDLSHALPEYVHTSYEAFSQKARPWYQRYDAVICVSQAVKESFDRIFEGEFRSEVLPNVVEDDLIRQKSKVSISGLTKRRLTMVAVGTMYPPKNYMRLLRAHERLLQDGIEHDLWILGDGTERQKLEHFIQDHMLSDSVTLFGFQENPFPYVRAADLLVCSSNYEGYSTVITEGLILGKPIVTTDCSGMREALGNSEYGIITANADDAFYEGLKAMILNPELRKSYAEKAAFRGQQFSKEALISKTEAFFREVVNR